MYCRLSCDLRRLAVCCLRDALCCAALSVCPAVCVERRLAMCCVRLCVLAAAVLCSWFGCQCVLLCVLSVCPAVCVVSVRLAVCGLWDALCCAALSVCPAVCVERRVAMCCVRLCVLAAAVLCSWFGCCRRRDLVSGCCGQGPVGPWRMQSLMVWMGPGACNTQMWVVNAPGAVVVRTVPPRRACSCWVRIIMCMCVTMIVVLCGCMCNGAGVCLCNVVGGLGLCVGHLHRSGVDGQVVHTEIMEPKSNRLRDMVR
jgi:hypothetical protein